MSHDKKNRICVVGASNIDLISYVPHLPSVGETLKGTKFQQGFGGKGANQAVVAAKLGADVAMITKVGEDVFGSQTIENFKKLNVKVKNVFQTSEASSGVAPIAVDAKGNNSIIIVGGANDLLTVQELESAREDIRSCRMMLCQLELPIEITLAALKIGKEEGVTTILNTAPAPTNSSDLPKDFFTYCDIVSPNEPELEQLSGLPVTTEEEVLKAARSIITRGAQKVLVTLGERGCLLVSKTEDEGEEVIRVPGESVSAVDTTGAGDCFLGSFAFFLANDFSLDESMRRANKIAALSVCGYGTQSSYPFASDPRLADIIP